MTPPSSLGLPGLASGPASATTTPSPTTTADRSRSANDHLSPTRIATCVSGPACPPGRGAV